MASSRSETGKKQAGSFTVSFETSQQSSVSEYLGQKHVISGITWETDTWVLRMAGKILLRFVFRFAFLLGRLLRRLLVRRFWGAGCALAGGGMALG